MTGVPNEIDAAAAAECERIVREGDPDRAVALAFAPAAKRPFLAALHAFDIETRAIRDHVSQPLPGEIRLQWWRDRIAGGVAGEAAGHPVADALLATIAAFDLPREAFDRFLEARIFDLYDDPMPDRAAFEAYAGETAATLVMMGAMVLDRAAAPRLADAAGHAGVALAGMDALRRLPASRRRGQVFLPGDLLTAAGCPPEALLRGEAEPAARAVAAMADFVEEHWRAYHGQAGHVIQSTRPAFLPAHTVPILLRTVRADPARLLEQPVGVGAVRRLAVYWRAMRR